MFSPLLTIKPAPGIFSGIRDTLFTVLAAVSLAACGGSGGGGGGGGSDPLAIETPVAGPQTPAEPTDPETAAQCAASFQAAGVPTSWSFEPLALQSVSLEGGVRDIEYVRGTGGQSSSYLLYIPSSDPAAPIMVINEPYDGINWTDESVDQIFADLGAGKHPDRYGPAWNGTDTVSYKPETTSPEGGSLRASIDLWIRNGFAVIKTYGRFYAGGSLANDVADAAAPWYFMASRAAEFEGRQRFSRGGSWGGMMALYGAAVAPAGFRATGIAVTSPPVLLQAVRDYALTAGSSDPAVSAAASAYFSSFIRRIEATNGADADTPFNAATLCGCLPSEVIIGHDDNDTIVPVEQTETLAGACPGKIDAVYWRRPDTATISTSGISHGKFGGSSGFPGVRTLTAARIFALVDSPAVVPADPSSIAIFLRTVSQARAGGEDIGYAVTALKPLLATNIRIQSMTGSDTSQTGADFLAEVVNATFSSGITAAAVAEALLADRLPF